MLVLVVPYLLGSLCVHVCVCLCLYVGGAIGQARARRDVSGKEGGRERERGFNARSHFSFKSRVEVSTPGAGSSAPGSSSQRPECWLIRLG